MKNSRGKLVLTACLGSALAILSGCQTHGVFVEAGHVGLNVEFSNNGITPINIDLGAERGVLAIVPQRDEPITDEGGEVVPSGINKIDATELDTGDGTTLILTPHAGELTSMYSWYDASIGIGKPISVQYFLATGMAAANIVSNPNTVNGIWDSLGGVPVAEDKNGGTDNE
jgi:hypothetical protein